MLHTLALLSERELLKIIKNTIRSEFMFKNLAIWPNDSIFHSIFSSTFDLKVERSRASVAKRLDFPVDFSLDLSTTHISATYIT